jgi:rod shape determining protein RodA
LHPATGLATVKAVSSTDRENASPMFNWVQRRVFARFDPLTPACMLALGVTGVFFIYSAQAYSARLQHTQFLFQIAWIVVGAIAYVVVSQIDYKRFLESSHWIWLATFAGLVAVKIDSIGTMRLGAQRWIDFGFVSIQPSEPAKLGVLVMCASILARSRVGPLRSSLVILGKLALAAGLPMLLILWQPDLGSALVIPPMVIALLYASNLTKRFFVWTVFAGILLAGIVVWDTYRYSNFLAENNLSPSESAKKDAYAEHSPIPYLKDYQRNRILPLVAPHAVDWRTIGWNLRQSLITVGSGGFAGKGWTEGTQARLGYLPPAVAHNDFIFSVLAEEKGFLGSVAVIGLFGLVLANGIRVAGLARDRFGTLLALGVTVVFAMHVFVNIGMTIGLVPITGLPLPFLSYGGSFLLSCCILQGLVQSVYRFRKDF